MPAPVGEKRGRGISVVVPFLLREGVPNKKLLLRQKQNEA
jgi:hypothetical protein